MRYHMKFLELTSLKNILIYSIIVSFIWMAIMFVFNTIVKNHTSIQVTLLTGFIFGIVVFGLTCVFSWKNLKH